MKFLFLKKGGIKWYVGLVLLFFIFLGTRSYYHSVSAPDPYSINKNSTNFDFHQISWQYFRWLTEEVKGGQLRFETLYFFTDIYPDDGKKKNVELGQSTKSHRNNVLAGIRQATSDGILVDKNGRAVYTTIMINDIYRNFILKNKLYDRESLRQVSDTLNFPVGAFSVKASWKIVAPGEDDSNFYITKAPVRRLVNEGNNIVLSDSLQIEKVALVGFHVAFVVNDHPELVWATFEHNRNAPYTVSDQLPGKAVSTEDFTFYERGILAQDCNDPASPILKLDEETQKLTPITEVFRQYRLGGGSSINQNNIDFLNKSEHEDMPLNSVWRNYSEVGAIWFNQADALKPNMSFVSSDPLLTGSTKLSNSVIETFTQADTDLNQCFGCHNTMPLVAVPDDLPILPAKNVLTSHILILNYLEPFEPSPSK